ncbi:hypothetical protein OnM2_015058 [Erysiphe neolycopersici]|uniref:Proteasome assembly chaperone 3 n=1 Tax=Erysiphe neolycopersici TaxID=212602 RepID=A0A420I5D1_9PEZI|nr:hypothetical protein OnM2_015058 [Erysiphe neolycopersici]
MESEDSSVKYTPFPAVSKQAKGIIGNIETEVTLTYFADQIMIIISQSGRLAQWIEVPISPSIALPLTELGGQHNVLPSENGENLLLPANHLTPKTLLGGGGEQRENLGHLLASHVATSITTRNPDESRTVLIGLGLEKVLLQREDFFDMMELLHTII